ncbi:MAG TPA: hypothetical protein VF068_02035, partial [Rubrobacter sp.]
MRKINNPAVTLAFFLVLGILSALGFVIGPGIPAARSEEYTTQTSKRPNIVFVLTDDQMPGTENRM